MLDDQPVESKHATQLLMKKQVTSVFPLCWRAAYKRRKVVNPNLTLVLARF
jgi:hypothetical protein